MPNGQQLEEDLYEATQAAFRELVARSHPESIGAFALYTDEDARTVSPAANTPTHLAESQKANAEFALDYKFSPAEWAYESEGADDQFDAICHQLSVWPDEVPADSSAVQSPLDELYSICFRVLKRLKTDSFFETTGTGPVMLLVTVSDAAIAARDVAMVRALNDTPTGDEYEQWVRTFTDL